MPTEANLDDTEDSSTTTYSNIFAAIVSTIRKEKKLSQKDIAEKLGLTVAAISKLESGGTQITFDHVYSLAYALNVEADSLFHMLDLGVKSFVEGSGLLINNFNKNENITTRNDSTKVDLPTAPKYLMGMTAAVGFSAINPLMGGAMLLGALGSGFTKHLRAVINESSEKQ